MKGPATEARARKAFPARTGMLVVAEVQPGSPADGRIAVGDILVGMGGRIVTDFDALAAVLDDSVGAEVGLELVVEIELVDSVAGRARDDGQDVRVPWSTWMYGNGCTCVPVSASLLRVHAPAMYLHPCRQ